MGFGCKDLQLLCPYSSLLGENWNSGLKKLQFRYQTFGAVSFFCQTRLINCKLMDDISDTSNSKVPKKTWSTMHTVFCLFLIRSCSCLNFVFSSQMLPTCHTCAIFRQFSVKSFLGDFLAHFLRKKICCRGFVWSVRLSLIETVQKR